MHTYYYGCAVTDEFLLKNPNSLPRFGNLARKVMIHYLGERYNPHVHGLAHEPFLRQMIQAFISYKVFHQLEAYDWEWIDHSFRRYFNGCFEIELPFSEERIKAGLNSPAKSPHATTQRTIH